MRGERKRNPNQPKSGVGETHRFWRAGLGKTVTCLWIGRSPHLDAELTQE